MSEMDTGLVPACPSRHDATTDPARDYCEAPENQGADYERCSCARHSDGSVTTSLCPLHAETDPCLTMATVTGKRRRGSVVKGVCSACGWSAKRVARIDRSEEQR